MQRSGTAQLGVCPSPNNTVSKFSVLHIESNYSLFGGTPPDGAGCDLIRTPVALPSTQPCVK